VIEPASPTSMLVFPPMFAIVLRLRRLGHMSMPERYGINQPRFPRWVIIAVVSAVTGVSWLLWTANHFSNPPIRSTLISFQEIDAKSIEIRYLIEIEDPTVQVTCRLGARDYGLNVVGEIDDPIPLGTRDATRIVRIPTRLAAVNASIESCSVI
jgi:hypothetical protein